MDNPGVFLIVLLGGFFLLWLATGGPSRPISFAGAYITPITNEGQTQSGYGPQLKIGGTVTLPGATLAGTEKSSSASASASTQPSQTVSTAGTSNGLVTLSHIAGSSSNPAGYIEISISSSAGKDIDITNWGITSSGARESGQIPTGILYMQLGTANTLQDITLRPGDKAIVAAGMSPAQSSFEGNECTGYLTSNQSDYDPCIKSHANDPTFLTGTWYVYLGRSNALWETHDTVSLLDSDGNAVASLTY